MSGLGRGYRPAKPTRVPLFGQHPGVAKFESLVNDGIRDWEDQWKWEGLRLPTPRKLAWNEVHESWGRYRPFLEGRVSVGFGWWKRWEDVLVWRR